MKIEIENGIKVMGKVAGYNRYKSTGKNRIIIDFDNRIKRERNLIDKILELLEPEFEKLK